MYCNECESKGLEGYQLSFTKAQGMIYTCSCGKHWLQNGKELTEEECLNAELDRHTVSDDQEE